MDYKKKEKSLKISVFCWFTAAGLNFLTFVIRMLSGNQAINYFYLAAGFLMLADGFLFRKKLLQLRKENAQDQNKE